jgi:hypothetical protein
MTKKDFQVFELIVANFERETMFSSAFETSHLYYQTIVLWGKTRPEIITWLLSHLKDNWHWMCAVRDIIGIEKAPLIPEEMAGQMQPMIKIWLEWGRDNGYLI